MCFVHSWSVGNFSSPPSTLLDLGGDTADVSGLRTASPRTLSTAYMDHSALRAAASRRRGRRRQGQQWGDEGGGYMYEGGGATRVAATRPEGGGDKCSDVAKGYTCNPNQGRG